MIHYREVAMIFRLKDSDRKSVFSQTSAPLSANGELMGVTVRLLLPALSLPLVATSFRSPGCQGSSRFDCAFKFLLWMEFHPR